jgi:hypothetical protein
MIEAGFALKGFKNTIQKKPNAEGAKVAQKTQKIPKKKNLFSNFLFCVFRVTFAFSAFGIQYLKLLLSLSNLSAEFSQHGFGVFQAFGFGIGDPFGF